MVYYSDPFTPKPSGWPTKYVRLVCTQLRPKACPRVHTPMPTRTWVGDARHPSHCLWYPVAASCPFAGVLAADRIAACCAVTRTFNPPRAHKLLREGIRCARGRVLELLAFWCLAVLFVGPDARVGLRCRTLALCGGLPPSADALDFRKHVQSAIPLGLRRGVVVFAIGVARRSWRKRRSIIIVVSEITGVTAAAACR